MLLRTIIIGLLLTYLLQTETTIAGSSFLSPEQPKTQQRKTQMKPTIKFHRRDAGVFYDILGRETEGDDDEIEIKFTVPSEIGAKISEEQYKPYAQILEKLLEGILAIKMKNTGMTQSNPKAP
uniref:Appetite-regulating hormone n=1 Tax=Salvator merianae TaxID=96440 RepID=A0A8D0B8I2_SALMN